MRAISRPKRVRHHIPLAGFSLRDAPEHPELHEDLIVRIGGYSEYFNRLSDALKRSVLERTQHGN